MNGRQRCDDIKAQLDTVSDQIKEAERAQHEQQHDSNAAAVTVDQFSTSTHPKTGTPTRSVNPDLDHCSESPAGQSDDSAAKAPLPGHQDKKRKRRFETSPEPEKNIRAEEDQEKKRQRTAEREEVKTAIREVPVKKVSEKLPDGKQRKHKAGDIPADAARGRHGPTSKEAVAPKEEVQAVQGPKDLPQLKKKRHLLYKQLQEARQQVPSLLHSPLSLVCHPQPS